MNRHQRSIGAVICGLSMLAGSALAAPPAALVSDTEMVIELAGDPPDTLILKDGKTVRGRVLEETDTQIRFMVVVAGIEGERTFSKADVLAVERGANDSGAAAAAIETSPAVREPDAPREGAARVYVVNVEGYFGRDITPTPVRSIAKDISKHTPDYVVLVVDNAWETFNGQEFDDTVNQFDQLWQTEEIEPIFTKEIPDMLGYTPEYVVWVKNAMGGAAFLPLNFEKIYFASEGRIGGIGRLEQIYGSTGDESVREKQFSLRLAHARGMANKGGHDARLIEAMARTEYVLSYRLVNGKVELFEGMPGTDQAEWLLTDDGQGDNEDNIQERARGRGDDNLTLNAEIARTIGVSLGTVDDMDSLLYELEIDRNHVVIDGREDRIRAVWTRSIENAEMRLRDLIEKFADIQVAGDRRERQIARSQQISTLREIKGLLMKFDEVISVGMFRIPDGTPAPTQIDMMIEQIRQEQMKDRP